MQPLIVAEQVRQGVADFLATTFPATTPGFETLMADFLATPGKLAQGPYVSIDLPFRKYAGKPMFDWLENGFVPHAHQARAFERLVGDEPKSTLIATGTGSGKTECFLYPVLEHCRQQRAAGKRGIKAILIYPMNALATDQASRLAREILTRPAFAGISAGLYVGDEPGEKSTTVRQLDDGRYTVITERDRLREEPPDILLTNYKMLDFLLIRARDSVLWRHNMPDTLRLLVVDELHTFDGAQGTDLACLIRRLKARLRTPPGVLACVGTSATLGSEGQGRLLAFADDVFGEAFDDHAVIGEDRESVAEYLANDAVEFMRMPTAADYERLAPGKRDAGQYIAAQYGLWFEADGEVDSQDVQFQVRLGAQLKQHAAFQNLLRDLHRLGGRAVALVDRAVADHRQQRAEDLLLHHRRIVAGLHDHGRRDQPFASCAPRIERGQFDHAQPACARVLDMRAQPPVLAVVDDAGVVGTAGEVAVAQAHLFAKLLHQRIHARGIDQHVVRRDAGLAGVEQLAGGQPRRAAACGSG